MDEQNPIDGDSVEGSHKSERTRYGECENRSKDFVKLLETGKASDAFWDHMENCLDCSVAFDTAFGQ